MWRARIKILPIGKRLVTRHVPIMDLCPMCQRESESIMHIFIQCAFAKEVWRQSPLGWFNPQVNSFLDRLYAFLTLFNENDIALSIYMCWNIWQCRNVWVWN